jgi:hypothetical protein
MKRKGLRPSHRYLQILEVSENKPIDKGHKWGIGTIFEAKPSTNLIKTGSMITFLL